MATLLELTSQGDVGTITDESKLSSLTLMNPQQLYELWERQPWSAHAINMDQDKVDWARLSPQNRDTISFYLSAFFIGEERVTTQFTGLVCAYEDQSEEAYLATQQVDEARHAQLFDRFYHEVIGMGGTFDQRLETARRELNDAFKVLFDKELVDACDRLLENRKDLDAKVDFVCIYMMVIEGTLALTGQYFITDYFEKNNLFPGFVEGFRHVSRDEHRHVAYGTWFLQQKVRENPAYAERARKKLLELIPIASGVLIPPGADPESHQILGYDSAEIHSFAFNALTRRLKVIGINLTA